MRIILNNKKVLPYFQGLKQGKNLLLLDWDETLYYSNIQRPHLVKFLKFATKYFVVLINTAGCNKEKYISKLNKMDGIHISGVISLSREKVLLNRWIQLYQWFDIDPKFSNFLLIDDRDFGSHSSLHNIIRIPKFEAKNKDDTSLLKLIPWLEQWHQYTNVNKIGTSCDYIVSHPTGFKFN